jgi:hypothetical protein
LYLWSLRMSLPKSLFLVLCWCWWWARGFGEWLLLLCLNHERKETWNISKICNGCIFTWKVLGTFLEKYLLAYYILLCVLFHQVFHGGGMTSFLEKVYLQTCCAFLYYKTENDFWIADNLLTAQLGILTFSTSCNGFKLTEFFILTLEMCYPIPPSDDKLYKKQFPLLWHQNRLNEMACSKFQTKKPSDSNFCKYELKKHDQVYPWNKSFNRNIH